MTNGQEKQMDPQDYFSYIKGMKEKMKKPLILLLSLSGLTACKPFPEIIITKRIFISILILSLVLLPSPT